MSRAGRNQEYIHILKNALQKDGKFGMVITMDPQRVQRALVQLNMQTYYEPVYHGRRGLCLSNPERADEIVGYAFYLISQTTRIEYLWKPMKKHPFYLDHEWARMAKWEHQSIQRIHPLTNYTDPKTGEVKNHSPIYSVDFMGEFYLN
jgi:hypothetical protein